VRPSISRAAGLKSMIPPLSSWRTKPVTRDEMIASKCALEFEDEEFLDPPDDDKWSPEFF
jgi:hypothetical protein